MGPGLAHTSSSSVTPQFEQRSEEWFQWRRLGIGSSDAAVLMGYGFNKNAHDLWLEKTDQVKVEFHLAPLAERGTRLEDQARKTYEDFTGIKVVDRLFTHPKYQFIRASLDGWSEEFELILEIKCPSMKNHYRSVAENYIKPSYYTQIQHQFLASNAKYADYWSFDGKSGHRIPVLPDPYFMGELLEREIIFWKCVETKTAPNLKDFKALK